MMARVRSKDTKLEVRIRKALFARGFRYRLHAANLPGKPDIVLPRYRAVVFVHGCFWHGHDCDLFRLPGTRREWWKAKIERNRARDAEVADSLRRTGWRQANVWECAVRGRGSSSTESVIGALTNWLAEEVPTLNIRRGVPH